MLGDQTNLCQKDKNETWNFCVSLYREFTRPKGSVLSLRHKQCVKGSDMEREALIVIYHYELNSNPSILRQTGSSIYGRSEGGICARVAITS
jgi:hypothetical protein